MPTYAFVCGDCGEKFEELVGMGKTAPCPQCGSKKVEKQVTAAMFNGAAASTPTDAPRPSGGGGCGPSCGCHH